MAEMSQIQDQATQCQPPLWRWELNEVKAFNKAQTSVVWSASEHQVLQTQSVTMSQVMTGSFRTEMFLRAWSTTAKNIHMINNTKRILQRHMELHYCYECFKQTPFFLINSKKTSTMVKNKYF